MSDALISLYKGICQENENLRRALKAAEHMNIELSKFIRDFRTAQPVYCTSSKMEDFLRD
jgi:hypothetical protein